MRGHVAKKGNRYYAVIYEGIDQATGRQRHRWYAGGATRKEAEKLLTEMVKRNHDGDYRAPERITLGAYLEERWLPAKRAQLRHSTWDSYRRNVEIHVKPRIGNIPLQRLAPEDLDSFYAGLLVDEVKRNGAGGRLLARSARGSSTGCCASPGRRLPQGHATPSVCCDSASLHGQLLIVSTRARRRRRR